MKPVGDGANLVTIIAEFPFGAYFIMIIITQNARQVKTGEQFVDKAFF
jgi:hypothetical protein